MKCAFTFNGQHYLSPSKKQARAFLKLFGSYDTIRRYRTKWKLHSIERTPSYFNTMMIGFDGVEFKSW